MVAKIITTITIRTHKDELRTSLGQALWNSRLLRGQRQFDLFTRIRHWFQQRRYDAPANPYKSVRINPQAVEYHNSQMKRGRGLGQIEGGNWDASSNCKPLDEKWVCRGLQQRFEKGNDWEQIVYYERAKRIIDENGSLWGYEDIEHFRDCRCEYVDILFDRIRRDGYRPNYEANHEVAHENSTKIVYNPYVHRLEPLVVIGRNGIFYWRDGIHRVTIAQILGLDAIPVNVLGRHSNWQLLCDRLYNAESEPELASTVPKYAEEHPDVRDVYSGQI